MCAPSVASRKPSAKRRNSAAVIAAAPRAGAHFRAAPLAYPNPRAGAHHPQTHTVPNPRALNPRLLLSPPDVNYPQPSEVFREAADIRSTLGTKDDHALAQTASPK